MTPSAERFDCPPGGAVEEGRRRLRRGLAWLAGVTLAVGGAAAWFGRIVPALLAVGAAALVLYTRRVSADLDPLFVELDGDELIVQMRRWRETFPLAGATARHLEPDEIEHLRRLATSARITAGTGGFDSHRLGELDLYASDLGRAVLVELDEGAVVVTPDDPVRFVVAVGARNPDLTTIETASD
ncbi:MAG: PH domain-containing protein [Thermoanaerobaculia bacterium]|nr:PH domain-containing protein [Thermoanaerobaculia bacterium]